jgi:ribonuclease/clavin/mitogillin
MAEGASSQAAQVMLGTQMPDIDTWSDRVVVVVGQNPSVFTGPGTNTYLVGSGESRILLDTGDGTPAYLPFLDQAMERCGCREIQQIVLTHGHPDHIGGCSQVMERFGTLTVSKMRYAPFDAPYDFEIEDLADGAVVETEGARLRAVHTPGHAPDHLCWVLEEEGSLFSGDNVLGIGTTVIPAETGDLGQYMQSLARLLEAKPAAIYPAHGPKIDDGQAKLREYIAHREKREQQILDTLGDRTQRAPELVEVIYAAYPKMLHAAAAQSVTAHLLKLEAEGVVRRDSSDTLPAVEAHWRRA